MEPPYQTYRFWACQRTLFAPPCPTPWWELGRSALSPFAPAWLCWPGWTTSAPPSRTIKTACGCPAKAISSATTRSRPSSPATGWPGTSAASISPKMEISARSPSKTGGICFGSIGSLDLRAGTLTS